MLGPAHGLPSPPKTPEIVPLSEWRVYGWQVQATCECGRTSIVDMGALLRKFGEQMSFKEDLIAARCWCMRCKRRWPKLVVVKG